MYIEKLSWLSGYVPHYKVILIQEVVGSNLRRSNVIIAIIVTVVVASVSVVSVVVKNVAVVRDNRSNDQYELVMTGKYQ